MVSQPDPIPRDAVAETPREGSGGNCGHGVAGTICIVLPIDAQKWVMKHSPQTLKEAVKTIEKFEATD